MIHTQNLKFMQVLAPQTVGTTAASAVVDTLDWDHVTILYSGAAAAAGALPGTLKLIEADAATGSYSDVTGAVGGTDSTGGFTIPEPNTSAGDLIQFEVNKVGRKRFLGIHVVGTATTRATDVVAILSRGRKTPTSESESGVAVKVIV